MAIRFRFKVGCFLVLLAAAMLSPNAARADFSFAKVVQDVNPKVVKVFGAGGFTGVTAYCSGVLVSGDGFILTVYSPTLDSREIRVHLADGRRELAELWVAEPQLDIALLRLKDADKFTGPLALEHFDLAKPPPDAKVGDWVLAFSNQFEIATGNEPMSVQRGTIMAVTPFSGRRGVTEATYKGTAYILDAITNNPGAHGGALTNRKGELVGLLGKELKNTLTETWVNYAMPITKETREFVEKGKKREYKPLESSKITKIEDKKAVHGIVLVPNVLDRTPPYIEEVLPGSPAARTGLKPDDLIVFLRIPLKDGSNEIDEKIVTSYQVFRETVAPLDPGTEMKVIVRRGQQLLSFDLKLEKR